MKRTLLFISFCLLGVITVFSAKKQLKVMSFNIRCSMASDTASLSWEARKGPCVELINEENPDIIGFQEPRTHQIEELEALLPQYQVFKIAVRLKTSTMPQHNVIMFRKDKFQLIDSSHFWLSNTPEIMSKGWDGDQNRVTLWTRLRDIETKKELFFFCTHLDHKGKQARLKGSELNVNMMKKIAGNKTSIFIVGDMNASYAAQDGRRLQLTPYFDWMWSARETAEETQMSPLSFNGFGIYGNEKPTWNIDYIFFRKVKPIKYQVHCSGKYGVKYVSDHWPITLICEY